MNADHAFAQSQEKYSLQMAIRRHLKNGDLYNYRKALARADAQTKKLEKNNLAHIKLLEKELKLRNGDHRQYNDAIMFRLLKMGYGVDAFAEFLSSATIAEKKAYIEVMGTTPSRDQRRMITQNVLIFAKENSGLNPTHVFAIDETDPTFTVAIAPPGVVEDALVGVPTDSMTKTESEVPDDLKVPEGPRDITDFEATKKNMQSNLDGVSDAPGGKFTNYEYVRWIEAEGIKGNVIVRIVGDDLHFAIKNGTVFRNLSFPITEELRNVVFLPHGSIDPLLLETPRYMQAWYQLALIVANISTLGVPFGSAALKSRLLINLDSVETPSTPIRFLKALSAIKGNRVKFLKAIFDEQDTRGSPFSIAKLLDFALEYVKNPDSAFFARLLSAETALGEDELPILEPPDVVEDPVTPPDVVTLQTDSEPTSSDPSSFPTGASLLEDDDDDDEDTEASLTKKINALSQGDKKRWKREYRKLKKKRLFPNSDFDIVVRHELFEVFESDGDLLKFVQRNYPETLAPESESESEPEPDIKPKPKPKTKPKPKNTSEGELARQNLTNAELDGYFDDLVKKKFETFENLVVFRRALLFILPMLKDNAIHKREIEQMRKGFNVIRFGIAGKKPKGSVDSRFEKDHRGRNPEWFKDRKGSGISDKRMQNLIPIHDGKYFIVKDLWARGTFSIKTPNGKPINAIKNLTNVSSAFKHMLLSKTVRQPKMKSLTHDEAETLMILKRRMGRGAPYSKSKNKVLENHSARKLDWARFQLLHGEVKIGNDNPNVIAEINTLVRKFASDGLLNDTQVREFKDSIQESLED